MARLILRLFCDPRGRQRDILVDLLEDTDTTCFEHEQQHKSLVDRLLHGGAFRAADEDRLVVDRALDLSPVFLGGG